MCELKLVRAYALIVVDEGDTIGARYTITNQALKSAARQQGKKRLEVLYV